MHENSKSHERLFRTISDFENRSLVRPLGVLQESMHGGGKRESLDQNRGFGQESQADIRIGGRKARKIKES